MSVNETSIIPLFLNNVNKNAKKDRILMFNLIYKKKERKYCILLLKKEINNKKYKGVIL